MVRKMDQDLFSTGEFRYLILMARHQNCEEGKGSARPEVRTVACY